MGKSLWSSTENLENSLEFKPLRTFSGLVTDFVVSRNAYSLLVTAGGVSRKDITVVFSIY